jgi:hypothetical protein
MDQWIFTVINVTLVLAFIVGIIYYIYKNIKPKKILTKETRDRELWLEVEEELREERKDNIREEMEKRKEKIKKKQREKPVNKDTEWLKEQGFI